jgi:hypothetical protein
MDGRLLLRLLAGRSWNGAGKRWLPYPAAARAAGGASFARAISPWHTVRLRPPWVGKAQSYLVLAASACRNWVATGTAALGSAP